jgi:YjbE family integral membrane protein
LDLQILVSVLSIVLIDLILGGDNAVVIALAVRSLPPKQRKLGILIGAGGAVVLRVVATFFAARLLRAQYVQLVGGILILWIAIKLFDDASDGKEKGKEASTFWRAISYIIVADITMSTDNVLAIAAASHGSFTLLLFGLGLSIPFVVFTSTLLSRLMDRYPWIIYLGAAVLGRVGAEMILTDAFTKSLWNPPDWLRYVIEAASAGAVVLAGRWINARRSRA